MSLKVIKDAIANKKMRCPKCKGAIQQQEKYVEMTEQIWDGAGDSDRGTTQAGSKVTLTCGNAGCDWKERTEFWNNYIDD
ncbi:MAG TPA: hypothetical protein V6C81_24390 [Planktothrix sp.]|jgi:hypothetical protein